MSPLQLTLIALLAASTALFAVGVSVESSERDTHVEPTGAQAPATETERAHEGAEAGQAHSEAAASEKERER